MPTKPRRAPPRPGFDVRVSLLSLIVLRLIILVDSGAGWKHSGDPQPRCLRFALKAFGDP